MSIEPTFTEAPEQAVPILTLPADVYWQARAQAAEVLCNDQANAIRQAVDWLRDGAPGRALEALETQL